MRIIIPPIRPLWIPQKQQLQQSLHRGCCCVNCVECPDKIPSQMTIDVAGTDITACCIYFGGGRSLLPVSSPDINGTYVLDSNHSTPGLCGDGDTCGYGVLEASAFTIENHSGTTCSSLLSSSAYDLRVTARFYDDGGGIRLWTQIYAARVSSGSLPVNIFLGQSSVLTSCLDVNSAVISNAATGCGDISDPFDANKCWSGGVIGLGTGGGTMTVTI